MKKHLKAGLCLILMLASIFCLCACGSESAPAETPIKQTALGRFDLQTIIWEDGTNVTGEPLEEVLDMMGETFVELNSDSTALLCLYGQRSEMLFSDPQLWKDGTDLMTYTFSVKDGKATLKRDNTTFVFVKQ